MSELADVKYSFYEKLKNSCILQEYTSIIEEQTITP